MPNECAYCASTSTAHRYIHMFIPKVTLRSVRGIKDVDDWTQKSYGISDIQNQLIKFEYQDWISLVISSKRRYSLSVSGKEVQQGRNTISISQSHRIISQNPIKLRSMIGGIPQTNSQTVLLALSLLNSILGLSGMIKREMHKYFYQI